MSHDTRIKLMRNYMTLSVALADTRKSLAVYKGTVGDKLDFQDELYIKLMVDEDMAARLCHVAYETYKADLEYDANCAYAELEVVKE